MTTRSAAALRPMSDDDWEVALTDAECAYLESGDWEGFRVRCARLGVGRIDAAARAEALERSY